MDALTALKLAGTVIPLIYYLRSNRHFEPITKRRAKEQESLEFISSFLAFDIKKRNRLVVEHAFEIYLRKRLSFEEIDALLQLANPLCAARMFSKAGQYVYFNSETKKFGYRSFVSSEKSRWFYQGANLAGYFLISILGIFLFLFSPEIVGTNSPLLYPPLGLVSLALLFLAYLFLEDGISMTTAKRFLEEAAKSCEKQHSGIGTPRDEAARSP